MKTLMRHHLAANCEDVGARFPEEARRIHYGESESRDICGEASPREAAELRAISSERNTSGIIFR